MEISEKEYSELKTKAAKWDALDQKLAEIYYPESNEDNDEAEEQEGNEDGPDLTDIGEIAASAFGYL